MNDAGVGVSKQPAGLLWWPRRRSVVLDAVLALFSALECALQGAAFADRAGLPALPVMLLGAAAGSVLLFRRRWPITVVLVSLAILPAQMGTLLVTVGLYTLATTGVPRRIVASLGAMISLGGFVVIYLSLTENDQHEPLPLWFTVLVALMFGVLHVVPPVLLGMYVRARRRLVESLRERNDGLERELSLLAERAEERAEWARREERTRIARDMHDVVAHRVSLMVVHAAALQAVALKDPEKAAKNAALVGDMGRQALTELRTMLGVLRTDDRPASGERPDAASRLAEIAASVSAAQSGPRLRELPALIKQSRDAGMAVEFSQDGADRGYAAPVERTAFRVVQEALTNVHKHAAGAATTVRLALRDGEVAVLVQNDQPAGGPAGGAALPSGGNGLLGMRERVNALGGGFVSGRTEQGGFRVSAVIPDRQEPGPRPEPPRAPEPAEAAEAVEPAATAPAADGSAADGPVADGSAADGIEAEAVQPAASAASAEAARSAGGSPAGGGAPGDPVR